MGFGVWGLGFGVWGLGFGVWGFLGLGFFGFGVFWVWGFLGLGFRILDFGFRVKFRVLGFGGLVYAGLHRGLRGLGV